jgi:hypothetical protein
MARTKIWSHLFLISALDGVLSFMPLPLYCRTTYPGTHWLGALQASERYFGKEIRIPNCPARSLVTMPTELSRLLLLCKLLKLFWHFVREFFILVKIWKMTHAVVLQHSTGSTIHPIQTTNHKRNDISLLQQAILWVLHCYIPYIVTRYLYRWHPVVIHQEHRGQLDRRSQLNSYQFIVFYMFRLL